MVIGFTTIEPFTGRVPGGTPKPVMTTDAAPEVVQVSVTGPPAIGEKSGEKLEKRGYAFGDAFDDSKLSGVSSERNDEGGQDPVGHLAGRVIQ